MAGAGIGEAMLLGAAMGGGSAAITGGDPLKGALLGGLTGGVGSGISGALGGVEAGTLAGGAAGSTPAITTIPTAIDATTAGQGMLNPALNLNPATSIPSGVDTMLGQGAPGINSLPAASAANPSGNLFSDPMKYIGDHKFLAGSSALAGAVGAKAAPYMPEEYNGPLKRFRLSQDYRATVPYAEGGITDLGAMGYDRQVGEDPYPTGMSGGGISNLGSYSDGGRMLRGPGDGMSDSIPASIAGKRPARLATEEFVVPADVVSHLGNGSSDAGAKQLYAMMDKVRQARTGRKSQGREINPQKYMPA